MFPRAARFSTGHANDVPGPNAYDPTEPESQYKRGAMFERDARFRAAAAAAAAAASSSTPTSTMCPHGCPISLTMGTTAVASSSKVKLDARLVAVEKEKVKLELRASKAEDKVAELQTQTATLLREKRQLQTEARMTAQKLERIQAQQQQQQQQQQHSPPKGKQSPQARLSLLPAQRKDPLQSTNDGKIIELQAQLEQLQARCMRAEEEKSAAVAFADGLHRKVTEAEMDGDAVRQRISKLERTLDDERRKSAVGMLAIEEKSRTHAEMLQAKLTAAEEKSHRDRLQCAALQEQSEHYKVKLVTLHDEKERLRRAVSTDDDSLKAELQSLRSENEKLRRAPTDHDRCAEEIAVVREESERVLRQRDGWFIIALLLSGENGALKEQQKQRSQAQIESLHESLRVSEQQIRRLQDVLSQQTRLSINVADERTVVPKAVNAVPSNVMSNVTQEAPVVLDEREAARRAWQMRPKSRTRSGRMVGADDENGGQPTAPLREGPRGKTLLSKSSLPSLRQHQQTTAQPPPLPVSTNGYRHASIASSSVTIDDYGDVSTSSMVDCGSSSASSTLNTPDVSDAPKRRFLRPQRSDASLDRSHRSSPVASLPSMDALAWELDKENAHLTVPSSAAAGTGGGLRDRFTSVTSPIPLSLNGKPALASFLRDGELAFHELTG